MNEYADLSKIYDKMTANFHYERIAKVVEEQAGSAGTHVLDVCCGSGTLARLLGASGFKVTGIDSAAGMIDRAVAKCSDMPESHMAQFYVRDIAGDRWGLQPETYHLATCTFDSLNYFAPSLIPRIFANVADSLGQGGMFVADFNSEFKLTTRYGNSTSIESEPHYLMHWRNVLSAGESIDFHIEAFIANELGSYDRFQTLHRQYLFQQEWVQKQLENAGFAEIAWMDDYHLGVPVSPETLRISFCARKK